MLTSVDARGRSPNVRGGKQHVRSKDVDLVLDRSLKPGSIGDATILSVQRGKFDYVGVYDR
jgi:hypothetical protein